MSTFDNVKETLSNKLEELKEEVRSDARQNDDPVSQEDDLQNIPDENVEQLDEAPENNVLAEPESIDRLATDYDLVESEIQENEENFDSGLDDFREDVPDEVVNDEEGNLIVAEAEEIEDPSLSNYDDGIVEEDFITEDYVDEVPISDPEADQDRRLSEIDELYRNPEPEETP